MSTSSSPGTPVETKSRGGNSALIEIGPIVECSVDFKRVLRLFARLPCPVGRRTRPEQKRHGARYRTDHASGSATRPWVQAEVEGGVLGQPTNCIEVEVRGVKLGHLVRTGSGQARTERAPLARLRPPVKRAFWLLNGVAEGPSLTTWWSLEERGPK